MRRLAHFHAATSFRPLRKASRSSMTQSSVSSQFSIVQTRRSQRHSHYDPFRNGRPNLSLALASINFGFVSSPLSSHEPRLHSQITAPAPPPTLFPHTQSRKLGTFANFGPLATSLLLLLLSPSLNVFRATESTASATLRHVEREIQVLLPQSEFLLTSAPLPSKRAWWREGNSW